MALSKALLEELYQEQGLSMTEMARRLGCSPNKVVYWMVKHGIPRRDISRAIDSWHNPDGDPFKIRPLDTEEKRAVFQLAMGLYIEEGSKRRHTEVAIGNTDPRVLRVFIPFLREICGVAGEDLFAILNVFDDVDLEETQAYWEQVTGLPRSQFHKSTVRQSKGGTYKNKSRFGTATVGV